MRREKREEGERTGGERKVKRKKGEKVEDGRRT